MAVLVLSNSEDATSDYLCARMGESGVRFVRIDTEMASSTCSILAAPGHMELRVHGVPLLASDVDVLWYRRPKPVGCLEGGDSHDRVFAASEWTAALEGFLAHVPASRWMNHPSRNMGASSKLEQLARAAQHGLAVPPWICTTSTQDAIRFYREQDERIVAKPLYCGYIERAHPSADTLIYTSRVRGEELEAACPHLGAPTLFQRAIVDGMDVRVTMVDDAIVAVGLSRDDRVVDIRRDNMAGVRYSIEQVPASVATSLFRLARSYGLRFAAIDLMRVRDEWYFLEVNPNGQWAWLDLLGDANIYMLFLKAFEGAE